jgi:hypothetical protein
MRRLTLTLAALALGAGAMYYLDPQQGSRRRALVRDKAVSLQHQTVDMACARGRDLRNRAQGLYARMRRLFSRASEAASDRFGTQFLDTQPLDMESQPKWARRMGDRIRESKGAVLAMATPIALAAGRAVYRSRRAQPGMGGR